MVSVVWQDLNDIKEKDSQLGIFFFYIPFMAVNSA
jgi:hypothetical protein